MVIYFLRSGGGLYSEKPQGKYEDQEEGTRWEHSTSNDLWMRVMGIEQRYEKLAVAQRKLERIILDITRR